MRGDRPTHQESARNLVSAVHAKKIDFCFLAASRAEAPALRGPRPPPGSLEAFSGGANAPSFARNGGEGAAQHPFYEIWPRGVAARRAAAIGDRGLQPPPTYMCFVAAVSGDEPSYSEIATAVAAGKLAPRGRRCATFPRTRAPSWFQLQTSGTLATKSSHMCWESLEASVPRDGAPTMIWRCFLHKIA